MLTDCRPSIPRKTGRRNCYVCRLVTLFFSLSDGILHLIDNPGADDKAEKVGETPETEIKSADLDGTRIRYIENLVHE